MRKIILLLFIIITFSTTINAQHYVKLNLAGLLYQDYGIGYEYEVTELFSIGTFAKASYNNSLVDFYIKTTPSYTNNNYSYSSYSISIEPTFHDNNMGTFIGIYGRYKTEEMIGLIYHNNMYRYTYNGFGFGLIAGQKKVLNSGIYFEYLMGVGRYLNSEPQLSDPNLQNKFTYSGLGSYPYFNYWELRLQVSIGYNFNSY